MLSVVFTGLENCFVYTDLFAGSITNQVRTNPKEEKLYKKIKAYNSYHKKHGVEAILNKKVQTLRMKKMDATASKPPTYTKCSFTEGGIKCCERALPVARHCRKHILQVKFVLKCYFK